MAAVKPATPAMSSPSDLAERFRAQLLESARVKQALAADPGVCAEVAAVLIEAYRRGNTLFLFGNGGSARGRAAHRGRVPGPTSLT